MQKRIIALSGAKDTGKTTALRKICRRFMKEGVSDIEWVDGKTLDDWNEVAVILTFRKVKIGIYSVGDVWCESMITEHINLFKEHGCVLIMCACRTRGETCRAISDSVGDYEVNWFSEFDKDGHMDSDSLWYRILDYIEEYNAWPLPVWKFGCRWNESGLPDADTKEVFRLCNVAFAVSDHVLEIREGDLIAVADGFRVIAIGLAMSLPSSLSDFKWSAREHALLDDYMDDEPTACRVKYYWLDESEQFTYEKQGRFCRANEIRLQANELFERKSKKA